MTTPEGRHETTDGSITAPCVCGEWHDLSFFLDAATRALLDIAEAAQHVQDEWDRLGPIGVRSTLASHRALRAALAALPTDR